MSSVDTAFSQLTRAVWIRVTRSSAPGGQREASATISDLRKRSQVEIEYCYLLPSK